MGGGTAPTTPIALRDLGARELAAWRELAAGAVEPNPFFEPEFVLPAARHLSDNGVRLIVVGGKGGGWLACMPVWPRVQVRRARVPGLSGWRHLYCLLGTPLVARSAVEAATERLLDQALQASRVGVVVFPWLGEDGPVAAGLLAALEARDRQPALRRSFERPVLHRAALAEGAEGLISSRHRRDLRRLARRLAEELDAPLELYDRSDSAAAVDDFLALEAAGWKGDRGTALASHPGHARFFREMCDGFRAAGRLQLLALGSEERAVSYQCSLLTGEAMFQFKVAFDESVGHYRPGLQHELRMLEMFGKRMSQQWIDSCADPDSVMFTRMWPERRSIGSYVISSSRAVGWTIDHGLQRLAGHGLSSA